MNTTEIIQKTKYLITSADVDFEEKIHVSSLVNFLIQSAWRHAEHLGWGVLNMRELNLSWVLSGLKLEISDYPTWKEDLTIETWPKGINRLFYLRDFNVYNYKQECIARGTSNWLMIDIDKRRPKLHIHDNMEKIFLKEKHALQEEIPSIKMTGEDYQTTEYDVRYTHIDINQHLTSTGYIDFVMNTFEPEFISVSRPRTITLNFLKEVVYGTKVRMLHSVLNENKKQFFLLPSENNKPLFACELKF